MEVIKLARHKLKPNYNKDKVNSDFINDVVEYFQGSYDDRDDAPNNMISLREVSSHFGISVLKVRKILITAGKYSIKQSRLVNELYDQGKTINEIINITGLSRSSVESYIPYRKTIYNLPDKSVSSIRQEKYRLRKTK